MGKKAAARRAAQGKPPACARTTRHPQPNADMGGVIIGIQQHPGRDGALDAALSERGWDYDGVFAGDDENGARADEWWVFPHAQPGWHPTYVTHNAAPAGRIYTSSGPGEYAVTPSRPHGQPRHIATYRSRLALLSDLDTIEGFSQGGAHPIDGSHLSHITAQRAGHAAARISY